MSTKLQGFAAMTKEKRTAIASKGGRAAHAVGRAHEWTVEEARAAGRKGGSVPRRTAFAAPQPAAGEQAGEP